MSNFTPKKIVGVGGIDSSYVVVAIELFRCAHCKVEMVPANAGRPFPCYYEMTLEAQAKRAGWRVESTARKDDAVICTVCAAAGAATFVCALCEERRDSSLIQETFGAGGGNSEHLCKVCYETEPAKKWEEKTGALHSDHQYDGM